MDQFRQRLPDLLFTSHSFLMHILCATGLSGTNDSEEEAALLGQPPLRVYGIQLLSG